MMTKHNILSGLSLFAFAALLSHTFQQKMVTVHLPKAEQIAMPMELGADQYAAAGIFVQGIVFPDRPVEPTKDQYTTEQIALILSYQ
ncbi:MULTISPECIES: hypothetical protein [Olivibacter]|uniref:SLH domain-containing protein n=1 Tax=Olivibacter jilunii TaxID=985016 RepID=A0ABW6B8G5_9SPHI|nr:hypothetical protein [Pseudosphingobacterium sp.]